jgi:hypothetical protein
MANLTPPQPPPVWTHTPEDVLNLTKEAIKKDREVQDKVAKLPASECNFDTVSCNTCLRGCDLCSHRLGFCKRLLSTCALSNPQS